MSIILLVDLYIITCTDYTAQYQFMWSGHERLMTFLCYQSYNKGNGSRTIYAINKQVYTHL